MSLCFSECFFTKYDATLCAVPQSVNILSVIRMSAARLKVIMLSATIVSVAMMKVIQCTQYSVVIVKDFGLKIVAPIGKTSLFFFSAFFTLFLPEFRTR